MRQTGEQEYFAAAIAGVCALALESDSATALNLGKLLAARIHTEPALVYNFMIESEGIHPDNAKRICDALRSVGFPIPSHDVRADLPTAEALRKAEAERSTVCPRCGNQFPLAEAVDLPDSGYVSYSVLCTACALEWVESYRFESFLAVRDMSAADGSGEWVDCTAERFGEKW